MATIVEQMQAKAMAAAKASGATQKLTRPVEAGGHYKSPTALEKSTLPMEVLIKMYPEWAAAEKAKLASKHGTSFQPSTEEQQAAAYVEGEGEEAGSGTGAGTALVVVAVLGLAGGLGYWMYRRKKKG